MAFKLSSSQRSSNARKAIATEKARGQKVGFARLSHEQRLAMAKKAFVTRKARGEIAFTKGHNSVDSVTKNQPPASTAKRTVAAHNAALKSSKLTVKTSARRVRNPIHITRTGGSRFEHAIKRRSF